MLFLNAKNANRIVMLIAAIMLCLFLVLVGLVKNGVLPPKPAESQILELAQQRAVGLGLTEDLVVEKPSLGKDGRLEYATTCSYYGGFNPDHASVIVCKEWTTIYYDDGRGTIILTPHTLKLVPQFLQSMPPGSRLYSIVVEESAKIDQMIFWVDRGRLYPEATK